MPLFLTFHYCLSFYHCNLTPFLQRYAPLVVSSNYPRNKKGGAALRTSDFKRHLMSPRRCGPSKSKDITLSATGTSAWWFFKTDLKPLHLWMVATNGTFYPFQVELFFVGHNLLLILLHFFIRSHSLLPSQYTLSGESMSTLQRYAPFIVVSWTLPGHESLIPLSVIAHLLSLHASCRYHPLLSSRPS